MTEKDQFASTHARECKTTYNLLKAFPEDKLDTRPNPKSRSARELAFVLANQELFFKQAVDGQVDFGLFANQPPATMAEILKVLEQNHKAVEEALSKASMEDLGKIVNFGGNDMRRMDALWANQFDIVHHRGQFSVYLRIADATVPSIYGPTADTAAGTAA
jgi:uncharacterized damage-inducible protein DinB